jgi:hypothetical protein
MPAFAGMTLLFGLAIFTTSSHAQTADTSVYGVTDVAVDVTADSAAHARDQAITQAQRLAFGQLLERLGVDASVGAKLSDDDIATLVQNFEVQNERASSVRYLGVFTVNFKPNAVRAYLGGRSTGFTEQRSPPIVILPVYESNGHDILWEENTRWRSAWDGAPHNGGLVPIIVPAGGLDDISVVSTEEAVDGTQEAIKALIDKYQAGGAAVMTLKGSLDNPAAGFTVDIQRYGPDGEALALEQVSFFGPNDKSALDSALAQGVKKARHQLEVDWKQDLKGPSRAFQQGAGTDSQIVVENGPSGRIAATVPIATLAQWAQIQRKLGSVPGIERVDVITLQRGAVSIEIQYRGDIEDVQTALMLHNLQLKQDAVSSTWFLYPF